MRIYIAASSHPLEIARAKSVRERLIANGHTITSTWIESVESVGAANPRDASKMDRVWCLLQCMRELRESETILALVPPVDRPTRGAWFELGYAAHLGCTVMCSGDTLQSIVCALEHEFATDDEALAFLGRAS